MTLIYLLHRKCICKLVSTRRSCAMKSCYDVYLKDEAPTTNCATTVDVATNYDEIIWCAYHKPNIIVR